MNRTAALTLLQSGKTLIGQHLGDTPARAVTGYTHFVGDLKAATGHTPVIIGAQGWGDGWEALSALFRNHANAGGLWTLNWRFPNPWTGENYRDTTRGRLIDLVTPGNAAYNAWQRTLEAAIERVATLSDVAGIMRPFHECSYAGGSWWAALDWWKNPTLGRRDAEDFKALYADTRLRFEAAGLTNLIWVLSTANRADPPASAFYAGNDYVDFCGPSVYEYNALVVSGFNAPAPLAYGEFGNRSGEPRGMTEYLLALREFRPAYALCWSSWVTTPDGAHVALVDNDGVGGLMEDEQIMTIEKTGRFELLEIAAQLEGLAARLRGM